MPLQCAELSERMAEDMASEGLRGKTLTLKLKETNFEVRTRNITLTRHISSREDIMREALKLLRAEMPITIRLMVILQASSMYLNSPAHFPGMLYRVAHRTTHNLLTYMRKL